MSEENKAKTRQFYSEVLQKGNLAVLDELLAPNFVDHQPAPGQAPGAAGVKQFVTSLHNAISGLQVTVEHVIAEGDLVAAHVACRGKHTGDLMGIPASGKDVVMRISDLVRIENGKAVERWGVEDMSGLMPQN
ncbi:MAG: ester cyclase [Candidatus Korobacteraceae bacterium]